MKQFKKLAISSLALAVLSSVAYAQDIKFSGTDYTKMERDEIGITPSYTNVNDTVSEVSIVPADLYDENIRVNLLEEKGEVTYGIGVATQMQYSDVKGEKLDSNFSVNGNVVRTKDVVLIGEKGAINEGVTIHNVADGKLEQDGKQAVNSGQLFSTNQKVANIETTLGELAPLVQANSAKLKSLDQKIAQVDRKAQQGIAAALAVAAIPQAVLPNESVIAFGAGNWRSENGVAIGFSHASGNGKWLFKVGAVNAGNNFGANAGVGYRW